MMADEKTPFQTLSSRIDWECNWYRVRRDEIALPDGKEATYNVVEMRDSAFILPVTSEGKIVLIRNYRYALKSWIWEIPAGGIQTGETAQEAAERELREEIGGRSYNWQFLLKAATMNGIGNHHSHFFLARDVVLSEAQHEETEAMTIHPMSVKDALNLAKSGEMNDALSICAILLAEPYLPKVRRKAP